MDVRRILQGRKTAKATIIFQVGWPHKLYMSNNSKVLSLKYRPQVFEDLIGQEEVTQTICNSFELKKIPNAYLFFGIRGSGKTSIARIIAKALNCKNGFEKLCKEDLCENCESISNSNHIDILEVDAASHASVENTRELIEFSRYGPSSAKYKIYILDECHMLSKNAWNSLLKTLEEPPEYLKFIFATTEIKKVPVTIISRCQRFDLSRVNSLQLFQYIKIISEKEEGKISDDALKLIVKISEGSVRDALSLLDRVLISQPDGKELDLSTAQKIFGYFDKSYLIELLKCLFEGNEKEVIRLYRLIYDAGVDPKVFLNDFLEVLYYLKNISSLKLEGTHFSLNDKEFKQISNIANSISPETIMLFWQFTIKIMDELDIVSNQNLSIEMFLIRLLYLKDSNQKKNSEPYNVDIPSKTDLEDQKKLFTTSDDHDAGMKNKTISQIKNISQEEKERHKSQLNENKGIVEIKNFEDLINISNRKKEIKLKYELETNVNLVSFESQRIEISFNENLDKDFIKILSAKLYDWTSKRWIITLSKKNGKPTKKQAENQNKQNLIDEVKKGITYKKIINLFPDAELIDIKKKDRND